MSDGSARSSRPSITLRISPAQKAWIAGLADAAGMSESAFALRAMLAILDPEGTRHGPASGLTRCEPASDRITIRLRPGDGTAIARRAAQRGMKSSTYVAALVRSHIAANPPLTNAELTALKQDIAILCGVGRMLARTARSAALNGPEREDLRQDLNRTRAVVAALEQHTHDLARAALISWETRIG